MVTVRLVDQCLANNHEDDVSCTDNDNWQDVRGYGCSIYKGMNECDLGNHYATNGVGAYQACCHCGGGSNAKQRRRLNTMQKFDFCSELTEMRAQLECVNARDNELFHALPEM